MNDRISINLIYLVLTFCCVSAATVRTAKNDDIQKFTIQMIGYSPQKVGFENFYRKKVFFVCIQ